MALNTIRPIPGSVIQFIAGTNNYSNSFGTTYTDINSALGVVWETTITPKRANSKLFIMYKTSFTSSSITVGFRVLQKIGAGSYEVVYRPEEVNNSSPFNPVDFGSDNSTYRNNVIIPVYVSPSYTIGDIITYKIQGSVSAGTINGFNTARTGNNGHSEVFIQEIAG